MRAAYRAVTPRTFRRELLRLAGLGFITFSLRQDAEESAEPIIELDFGTIEKYRAYA